MSQEPRTGALPGGKDWKLVGDFYSILALRDNLQSRICKLWFLPVTPSSLYKPRRGRELNYHERFLQHLKVMLAQACSREQEYIRKMAQELAGSICLWIVVSELFDASKRLAWKDPG